MSDPIKIVFIGAGSMAFGRAVVCDALSEEVLKSADCTLTLVDIGETNLDRIYEFANLVKEYYKSTVKIEKTTDRLKALPGADYVIISAQVLSSMPALRASDYNVPFLFGFKQGGGAECGMPGSLFYGLRSFELVLPICRDVEELCPNALVMSVTNPVAKVTMGVNYLTKVRFLGICDGIWSAPQLISRVLDRPEEELNIVQGGINHFYWVLKIADARTGEDLYPEFRARVRENARITVPEGTYWPLVRKLLEIYGYLTYPADTHPAEYLQFSYDLVGGPSAWGTTHSAIAKDRSGRYWATLEPYIMKEKPIDQDIARPRGELPISIVCDIEFDRGCWRRGVNVVNRGSYVENLPTDAVVEVPAVLDAQGVHPQKIGSLPEPLAAFTRTQISINKLLVEAYRARSKNLLLQALLLDPVVDSISRAEDFLDTMLRMQAKYLPKFE